MPLAPGAWLQTQLQGYPAFLGRALRVFHHESCICVCGRQHHSEKTLLLFLITPGFLRSTGFSWTSSAVLSDPLQGWSGIYWFITVFRRARGPSVLCILAVSFAGRFSSGLENTSVQTPLLGGGRSRPRRGPSQAEEVGCGPPHTSCVTFVKAVFMDRYPFSYVQWG